MNRGNIFISNWWRTNRAGILDLLRLIVIALIVFAIWWGAWDWIDTNVLPADTNVY